jgi:hypothetical protein
MLGFTQSAALTLVAIIRPPPPLFGNALAAMIELVACRAVTAPPAGFDLTNPNASTSAPTTTTRRPFVRA